MTRRSASIVTAVCLILSLFISVSVGQESAGPARSSRWVEVTMTSPSLKGNLLGDPVEQKIAVYLPPSYDASPAKRYPTVYLLHGFGGTSKTWIGGGFNVPPLLDAMIKDGRIREMIVVAPSGRNAYLGSFYTNSAVLGNWGDYISSDLIAFVDANYRTHARPSSRGIAGHSMGGYGAMVLGMKYPNVFGAVYSLSPCCFNLEEDLSEKNPRWTGVLRLQSVDQLPKSPRSLDEFFTIVFVALSAAFSPNAEKSPFYVDLPFQESDGKLVRNESAYASWLSKMPVNMVEDYETNLRGLRGIFFDYGEKEEFSHIRTATSRLSRVLAERNIPHVFEVYEGGTHSNKIRERLETRVFRFFSDRLDFSTP